MASRHRSRNFSEVDRTQEPLCNMSHLGFRFLRPTPLGPPLLLVASAVEISERAIVVDAELKVDEETRATTRAKWVRFQPR